MTFSHDSGLARKPGELSGKLTVGIATRNRIDSLVRCLESLRPLADNIAEVIVVDDASDVPVEPDLAQRLGGALPFALSIVRQPTNLGTCAARNRIAHDASADLVLMLDDDTQILDAAAIHQATAVMRADDRVAAIAFAQGERDGSGWLAAMQAAPVDYPCQVTAFIGFGHLLRRALFVSLGGYQELFHYFGEEKDYCLRALDAGYRVVFLPAARIAHLPDPAGRDALRYFRLYNRNDCLTALFSYPWLLALIVVGRRVLLYPRTARKHINQADPTGRSWLLGELRAHFREVMRQRRPVRWRTLWKWRQLKRSWPPYNIKAVARQGGGQQA